MQTSVKLEKIGQKYAGYRLSLPETVRSIQSSMETQGQLRAVILQKNGDGFELVDGFKRYHAAQHLQWDSLYARIEEIDEITAKRLIMSYNQQSSGLSDYEEAKIVYSLKTEHGLKQEDISQLLSRSISWVSRRLGFIERLGGEVQTQLQLGAITATHARELAKLPRGKQDGFLKSITQNCLTSRQTVSLVNKYLKAKTAEQRGYLLKNPVEAISQTNGEPEIYDCRLGKHANRLLRTASLLLQQQHIFIGQSNHPPIKELREAEAGVLGQKFVDILKQIKIIQSILRPYVDHER